MLQSQSPWNAIPAVKLAVAVAGGIVAAEWLGYEDPRFGIGLVVVLASCAGLLPLLVRSVKNDSWLHGTLALLVLFAAALLQHQRIAFSGRSNWLELSESGNVTILSGRVRQLPSSTRKYSRAILGSIVVQATGERLPGRLLVYLRHGPAAPDLAEDATIVFRGRVAPLPAPGNPSDFDYGRFLRRRGIRARVFLDDPGDLCVFRRSAPGRIRLLAGMRSRIDETLQANVADSTARAVVRSLVLGDRSRIPPDVREAFISSGLVHLLAVSGLHVMIVGMIIYRLLRPALLRIRFTWRAMEITRMSAAAALLITYMFVTGRPPSVVRAVIMAIVFMLGAPFERRSQSVNSLAVAAIIILLWHPSSLFEAGFQLSFSAVLGIVTIAPSLQRSLVWRFVRRIMGQRASDALAVSAAASAATLPVLLFNFGKAPLAGIVLNLIGIPLTAIILTAGLLSVVTSAIPVLARPFGHSANIAAQLLESAASSGSDWFGGIAFSASPHLLEATSLSLVLVGAALLGWSRKGWKWLVGGLLLISLWQVGRNTCRLLRPRLELLFFDVGHGDAALLQAPSGRTILVDAGPAYPSYDAGRQIILPHLNARGIHRIDVAIISHGHSDHIGGFDHILRNVSVGRLVWSGSTSHINQLTSILTTAQRLGVPIVRAQSGDTILVDPDLHVAVLGPDNSLLTGADENDRSVIVRVQYGHTSFLFTGDAEEEAEAKLVTRFDPLLKVNVVKVPHHGSRTSSGIHFVESALAVSLKQVALVSVAERSRYGLPDEEVINRWIRAGFLLHLTAEEDAMLLQSDGETVYKKRWR